MNAYSITREDPERDLDALRDVIDNTGPGYGSHPRIFEVLKELADSIEEQVKDEGPKEFGSMVRAGIDGISDRVSWVFAGGNTWIGEDGTAVGSYSFLHHPEVLRIGVGEAAPSTEEEIDQQQAEANRILHKLNTVAAGEITPPDPDESRFYEAQSSETHQDHVSLEVVLQVLEGIRDASITAAEKEAVQRCIRSCMQLATYVGCWP